MALIGMSGPSMAKQRLTGSKQKRSLTLSELLRKLMALKRK
jgi:hypothetical protein